MKPTLLPAVLALAAATACTGTVDEVEPNVPQPASSTPSTSAPESPTPTGSDDPGTPSPSEQPPDMSPEVVARNFEVPWGIAFLPDGSALVAERSSGTILRLVPGGVTEVGTVPGVVPTSEGGLLGLAVSPTYSQDQTIYAYYTTDQDNRVATMTFDGRRLGEPEPILTGIPASEIHDGGRIEFGPDDMLYVTTGEAGNEELAQDPESLGGKILRLEPDGDIPPDNPRTDSPVWTLGHRNVQGIAWDDAGRMWATEFGSTAWDELNLIEPGNNYGWPAAEGRSDLEEFTDPVLQWETGEASPSGLANLDGSLWMAALQGERLYRIPVRDNGRVGEPRQLYVEEYGRLRTVVATPDGDLWFTTSNRDGRGDPAPADDRIFEIRP